MSIKRVAAIHDMSGYGRCSLTVAIPIISVMGIQVCPLPTAYLSTHTGGFTGFTYRDLTEDINPIKEHWLSLGLKFSSIYTGFLGSFEQIDIISALFDELKSPETLILVDPVMADNGKLYSIYSPEMARGMAKLCKKADMIVPNLTEAAFILDEEYRGDNYDQNYIESTLKKLAELGPEYVVLTGVSFDGKLLGAATYTKSKNEFSYSFCDCIEGYFHGTGDVFGSTLLSAIERGFPLNKAAGIAVDYTQKCIIETVKLNQEIRYGVAFERVLPYLIERLGESQG